MQKQVPQAYKTNHASCEFITLPCKQQSTVLKMNSLLLFLFLGASVALAELPFDHPALVEFLNEEGEELFGAELADEENDPRRPRPSPPPFVVKFFVSHCFSDHFFTTYHLTYRLQLTETK